MSVRAWLRDLRLLKGMHWPMVVVTGMLLGLGVLFIYSACYISEDRPVRLLYQRQLVWIVAGIVCYAAFAATDYRQLVKVSPWAYAGCVVLLGLVMLFGKEVSGARRWLVFFGDRGLWLQPSEFAKLGVVLLLADRLSRKGESLSDPGRFLLVVAAVGLPVVLVITQPDYGTAMVFVPVAGAMMFVAGVPLRYLVTVALLGLVVGGIVMAAVFLPEKLGLDNEAQTKILRGIGLREYHRARIESFVRPGQDPMGAGWNKTQSEIAVGSGGPWGKGYLKGTQNILGFLPRTVAPTDFIYSVIAEEMGFAGSVIVLLLFGGLSFFGIQAAVRASDMTGCLLSLGVVVLVFCHAFVNVAMTVGVMPIIGLPLPLLSYGGSFLIVTMSALGLVQSVHIRRRRPEVTI